MALSRVSAGGLIIASPVNDDIDLDNAADYGASAVATTAGTDTTTSASYANLAGTGSTTSFSFTKVRTDTRVRLEISAGWFSAANSSVVKFGMRINSVDYDCFMESFVSGGSAMGYGWTWVPSGLAAGTYTVQARWLRVSGAGTPSRSTNDWLAISARECW